MVTENGNAAITTTTTTTSTTTTATTTTTTATAAACGERRKQLACEVVQSDNVGFLEVPGVTSPDKPYHVLNDMCQGRRAVRSKDRCDSGCKDANGTVCLRTTLLEYLVNLKNNGRIVIKELTGACHRNGCSHQWGKAVDLHRDGRTMEYISMCQLMGGTVFPLADDIHCHF
ncbi:uncharacterized protein LOC143288719 [Babylonia areolata]|uniref:uncharacterized protein LOC143288719 n=1 Tax=Babylonia areolata TaxID=304850 RepID=UPI003FD6395B